MKRLVTIALLGAVTACGSTVPLATQQQQALSGGDGLGPSATGSSTGALDSVQTAAPRTNLPTSVTPVGPAGPTSSSTPSLPTGAAVSRATIKVGVLYLTGADQAAAALGIDGLSTGDSKAQAKAVFDWAATHGGFGGHKTEVSYYPVDASQSSSNPEAAQQRACTSLVQDHHVRYVVSMLQLYAATMACFAKAGVIVIDDASALTARQMASYSKVFVAPGDFSADRLMKELIDGLWRRGWLNPKSKVGVFTYDTPDDVALVDGPVRSYLKAHGITPVSVNRGSNGATGVNDASAAVLKFQAAGVDRILPVQASPLFLMQAANAQRYHPAYATYSFFGPGALLEATAPREQLKNAAGMGYSPYLDIGSGTRPGAVTPNETLCFAILKAAGQQSTSATTKGIQLQLCNAILFLKAMTDHVPSLPTDLLTAARPLIAASFPPADTFRTDVSKRNDGAAGYRDLAFQDGCACFQYVSGVHATS
jgi:hypothetical protein